MFTAKVTRKRHHKLTPPATGSGKVKVGVIDNEVDKAVWNHFGTRGGASGGGWGGPIPERPWIAISMRQNKGEYRQDMRAAAWLIVTGQTALGTVLARLGAKAQGDMQQTLTSLSDPPNSPVTIERKGSSNPLIDTGALRQAHTWELM